jgi:thiosulfate/3-mercaptopyruvate sulfurtransferase
MLFAAAVALLASAGAPAGEIVDAKYVADALRGGAIVWDVRGPRDYAEGHIPGAVNIGNIGAVLRNPNTEDFLPTPEIEKMLDAAGIDLGKEVIVYSRNGDSFAYFGLTAVRQFGGKHGKVFHGGLDEWVAAGMPVSKEPTRLAAVAQRLAVDPNVQVYLPEVLSKVNSGGVQFLDVRTPKEFSGDDIRALRGGHIPGARNIPFEQNWVDPNTGAKLAKKEVKTREGMALKPAEQLKALYAGLDPNKETIVYCQSGVRASETAVVLRQLGFTKVRVFEESWLGYGNNFAAPAESVQFLNVGALKGQIGSLEHEVEALQAEIARLRAAK